MSSVCRRAPGDVSVLSSQPCVHIPEAGTAVAVLVSHMETWQRKREEQGWKREWETLQKQEQLQLMVNLTVPWDPSSPNDSILGAIPHQTGFCVTAGCW